ncbi:MAG TPA: glycosyltransferase family 39 protein [Polyangiales bacterium]|nr:glycosyltransferase family 39 protein [Polyangiales bacterium]
MGFLQRIQRLPWWVSCALPAAAFFAVSLAGLDRMPYFGNDEIYPSSTALTFVREGRFAREITAGSLGTNDFDAYPPMWMLLLAGTYKVFGVGIWTTRVPCIAVAALAIFFLAAAVYRITSSAARAALAGTLLSLDPILLHRARIGRSEPLALMFLTLGLFAVSQPRRLWWWACGVSLVLGIASYQFAALPAVALGVGLLAAGALQRAIWVAAGGVTGVGLWCLWSFGHWDLFELQVLETGRSYSQPLVSALLSEWQRYAALAQRAPTLIPVLLLGPVVALYWLRPRADVMTRAVCVASAVMLVLLAATGMKSAEFYYMFLTPFVYFVLAQSSFAQRPAERRTATALVACSALAGVVVLAGISVKLSREWACRDARSFDAKVAPILEPTIAAGKLVVGPTSIWLSTINRGGKLRVLFDAYGPHTETLLKGFFDDPRALSEAGVIALTESSDRLMERYPQLKDEIAQRIKVGSVSDPCGPTLFSLSFFERPASHALRATEIKNVPNRFSSGE